MLILLGFLQGLLLPSLLTLLLPSTPRPRRRARHHTSASVSLSLSSHVLFSTANPNKVGIKYDESRFTVMYLEISWARPPSPASTRTPTLSAKSSPPSLSIESIF
ncbi:hypothetical protein ACFX2G_022229 [Malus domestica]